MVLVGVLFECMYRFVLLLLLVMVIFSCVLFEGIFMV